MTIDCKITRETEIVNSPRLQQVSGIFDLPPAQRTGQTWHHKFILPDQWNIGVIVGPSGAGKTTLAREAFGDRIISGWPWPADLSLLDGFPAAMGIKDITALLSSVGFNSPPSWTRPFSVLSNGEQFRVTLARTLAEMPDLAVVDEFTSVVDRQVARIGSAAVAKAVRRRNQKLVAVSCHYDILDWLEPDWVYEPATGEFRLNRVSPDGADASRGSLWRRPPIELEVARVHHSAWALFKQHHYLSGDLNRASKCFVAFHLGRPAAFVAVLPFPHSTKPAWREHRTVCLPDFQGVGIGNAVSEFVASLFAGHKPYQSCTSHPGMIGHRSRSPLWRTTRKHSMIVTKNGRSIANSLQHAADRIKGVKRQTSTGRMTASFRYVGPVNAEAALRFAVLPSPAPPRAR